MKNDLGKRLLTTTTPVFVIDAERRLTAFNAGCEKLTGWPATDVLGKTCHYASHDADAGVDALINSLCPPPEAFAGDETNVAAYVVQQNGPPLPRLLHFFPLQNGNGNISGLLGLITTIPQPHSSPAGSPAQELHAELAALRMSLRNRFGSQTLVCQSQEMSKVLSQMQLAQQVPVSAILAGEPGTGKEHLARVIHFGSPARANWFVPLDCQRLGPDELQRILERLIEVHHVRPSGSAAPQPGTLYLADVEYLPRDMQERLASTFRIDNATASPQLRLLASTSLSLTALAEADVVRPDFLSKISTLAIELPPLRERVSDLPIVAQHFLEELNRQGEKQVGGFEEELWPLLTRYRWPRNLDELLEVIREAHARCTGNLISLQDLPFRFRTALDAQEQSPPPKTSSLFLDPLLTKAETRLITLALERSKYNKSKAADLLGINRARLYRRMEQLGIEDRDPTDST